MRAFLILIVACGGSVDEPLHKIGPCGEFEPDRTCEAACADWPDLPRENNTSCTGSNPTAGNGSCDLTPIVDYMGTRGCCIPVGDVVRFLVCEP